MGGRQRFSVTWICVFSGSIEVLLDYAQRRAGQDRWDPKGAQYG